MIVYCSDHPSEKRLCARGTVDSDKLVEQEFDTLGNLLDIHPSKLEAALKNCKLSARTIASLEAFIEANRDGDGEGVTAEQKYDTFELKMAATSAAEADLAGAAVSDNAVKLDTTRAKCHSDEFEKKSMASAESAVVKAIAAGVSAMTAAEKGGAFGSAEPAGIHNEGTAATLGGAPSGTIGDDEVEDAVGAELEALVPEGGRHPTGPLGLGVELSGGSVLSGGEGGSGGGGRGARAAQSKVRSPTGKGTIVKRLSLHSHHLPRV